MEIQKSTILPELPSFSDKIAESAAFLSFDTENRQDVFLFFLAILYHNQDNKLDAYNFLFSLIEKDFQHSHTFAKFHYCLVNPPQNTEEILKQFCKLFTFSQRNSIVCQLQNSKKFYDPKNQEIFRTALEEYTAQQDGKNFLSLFSAHSKEQLQNLSKQVKDRFLHILSDSGDKSLEHPLEQYQENLYAAFHELSLNTVLSPELREDISHFLTTLKPQEFHISIVGEGKRGKSSLLNALLRQEISFVAETLPKTAVPLEFYYAEKESYTVELLSQQDFLHLKNVQEINDIFFADFEFGKKFSVSESELKEYMDVDGKYVRQTAKIYIGLPNPFLKKGFHLSDTPGLNCINTFHDYLTFNESLLSDCLIFVMDARKPDSASEFSFLQNISQKGRVIKIIGVVSGIDRLNKEESGQKSLERAKLLFQKLQEENPLIQLVDIFPLNPKALMEHFCSQKNIGKEQKAIWNSFVGAIEKIIGSNAKVSEYKQKISDNAQALLAKINQNLENQKTQQHILFPQNFINILDNHEKALVLALEKYRSQALQVTESVEKDIQAWKDSQNAALDEFEKKFVHALLLKVYEHADKLGTNIAKSQYWKDFDQNEAKETAQKLVEEFIQSQEKQLLVWEEKIKIFHKTIHALSNECLETISLSINSMGSTSIETSSLNNILIQGNIKMKQISLFLAGAGSGFALSASFFNIVTVGSIALAFLGDPISISGLLLTGIGAVTLHFQGDLQKHKKAILAKKQKKIEQWAQKVKQALEQVLEAKQKELIEQYQTVIKESFIPSFELLFSETVHIHWYTQHMHILSDSISQTDEKIRQNILTAQKALNPAD